MIIWMEEVEPLTLTLTLLLLHPIIQLTLPNTHDNTFITVLYINNVVNNTTNNVIDRKVCKTRRSDNHNLINNNVFMYDKKEKYVIYEGRQTALLEPLGKGLQRKKSSTT